MLCIRLLSKLSLYMYRLLLLCMYINCYIRQVPVGGLDIYAIRWSRPVCKDGSDRVLNDL